MKITKTSSDKETGNMQENVCKKYGITRDELQKGVDRYSKLATGKFAGDINVLLAILGLLCNGDTQPEDN